LEFRGAYRDCGCEGTALHNTVQPSISRSISDLERALGVRLLDRHRQGVEPTDCGRALLDCGVAVFDALRQGMKSVEFLANPATGEAHVGGNPFLAATFGCAVVDRLSERYPRIVVHLTAGSDPDLYRKLRDRNLDLLIIRKFGPIDERLEFEFLFNDSPFLVAAGARSPWARRRKIELAELVNESWVLPPASGPIGSVAAESFRASGLAYPRRTMFVDTRPSCCPRCPDDAVASVHQERYPRIELGSCGSQKQLA
jgi:DNA-binding transcriptional LysR family regulator